VSRPRHKTKEFEDVLRSAEEQGWRVVGGGDKYFKMKCPCPNKCMQTVRLTPSNPNYLKNLIGQLRRATCWKEV
jgi:hypothetical protein